MKKILSLVLALALAVSCCALFGGTAKAEDAVITKVALVTDVGTILQPGLLAGREGMVRGQRH